MKLFCSYAFTGEDLNIVTDRMRLVVDRLNQTGHDAYCPIFDPYKIELQTKNDIKSIFEYAFQHITKSEGLVAIVSSDRRSEGQLMEIGAALSQHKPVYLFAYDEVKNIPSHLPKLVTKVLSWTSHEELEGVLAAI